MADDTLLDAFQRPQRVKPGCQHRLGCNCTPPYWLRASSPVEEAKEARLRELFSNLTMVERQP